MNYIIFFLSFDAPLFAVPIDCLLGQKDTAGRASKGSVHNLSKAEIWKVHYEREDGYAKNLEL